MEIIDRKLTTHRCRKGKESHQGGVMGGFNCTGNVLLPKWCGEYMNAYFISLYTIFICLKCVLMRVYIIGKMCTGERKNVKEREGRLERGQQGERGGYRAGKSTGFILLHRFWWQ